MAHIMQLFSGKKIVDPGMFQVWLPQAKKSPGFLFVIVYHQTGVVVSELRLVWHVAVLKSSGRHYNL